MEYINFALWVDGSSFAVGKVEEDSVPSVQPHLTSISTPDLEAMATAEKKPDWETQLMPTTDIMQEPMPATEPAFLALIS